MKIGRLFSEDSHLPFSILFAGLALLLLAFKVPSFPQNPGLLLLFIFICGIATLCALLALDGKRWVIAPIIGIAATFVSALYSTTVSPVWPCGSIQISQGYPYPWIQRFSFPSNERCPVYFEPMATGLPQFALYPNPIFAYIGFITDALFYTLLTLAIFEIVAATRRVRLI